MVLQTLLVVLELVVNLLVSVHREVDGLPTLVVYVEYLVSVLVTGTLVTMVLGLSTTVWVVTCLGKDTKGQQG